MRRKKHNCWCGHSTDDIYEAIAHSKKDHKEELLKWLKDRNITPASKGG